MENKTPRNTSGKNFDSEVKAFLSAVEDHDFFVNLHKYQKLIESAFSTASLSLTELIGVAEFSFHKAYKTKYIVNIPDIKTLLQMAISRVRLCTNPDDKARAFEIIEETGAYISVFSDEAGGELTGIPNEFKEKFGWKEETYIHSPIPVVGGTTKIGKEIEIDGSKFKTKGSLLDGSEPSSSRRKSDFA